MALLSINLTNFGYTLCLPEFYFHEWLMSLCTDILLILKNVVLNQSKCYSEIFFKMKLMCLILNMQKIF